MPHFNKTLLNFQIQSFCFEHCRNSDNSRGPGLYVSLGVRWRTFPTDTKHTFGFICLFGWLKCSFCLSSRHWRWTQVRFLFIQLWAFYIASKSTICEMRHGIYISTKMTFVFACCQKVYFRRKLNLGQRARQTISLALVTVENSNNKKIKAPKKCFFCYYYI